MEDTQLVTLAQEGHSEAVAQLYDKYFDPIYRYCYWQTNRDEDVAQDLTHDTFVEMAKSLKNFRGDGSFKNWLYTIAKRQINSWVSAKYDAELTPLFDSIPDEEDVIDPEKQAEKVQLLNQVLNNLKPRDQEVLKLRYLRNYSVAETAEALDLSESNVKVITHRSLKELEKIDLEEI